MVQSYLSYPFHANTHTHFFSPSPLLASTARLGDSYKRRVIRRKDCTAERGENGTCSPLPSPFSPCLPGRSIKPVSMGAQSPPTLFRSGHLPREREEEIGGSWRERERRVQKRGLYTNGRGACLSVSRLSRNVVLGLAWVAAGQIFSDSSQIVSPPRWADALFALLPDGIYRLFRVD